MPANSRSETWIKLLFAAVIVLFPLQLWFIRQHTEPYPALVLPSFAGASLNAAGEFSSESADIVVFFADWTSHTVSLRTLFADAPSSQFRDMAAIALKPKLGGPPPDNVWGTSPLNQFIRQRIVPGLIVRTIRQSHWTGVEAATVAWVRERMQELFRGRACVHVDVVWYADVYTWRKGVVTRYRKTGDTVHVEL